MSTEQSPEASRKKIIRLYTTYGLALLLSFIPTLSAALLSLILFLGVLIAAYVIRAGVEKGSFVENHATFTLRTIWIGSFIMSVTLILGSIYLLYNINNAALMPCIDRFANAVVDTAIMANPEIIMQYFQSCMDKFIKSNMKTFIISGLLTAGAPLIYFIYRFIKGLLSAAKSQHVKNHTSWL